MNTPERPPHSDLETTANAIQVIHDSLSSEITTPINDGLGSAHLRFHELAPDLQSIGSILDQAQENVTLAQNNLAEAAGHLARYLANIGWRPANSGRELEPSGLTALNRRLRSEVLRGFADTIIDRITEFAKDTGSYSGPYVLDETGAIVVEDIVSRMYGSRALGDIQQSTIDRLPEMRQTLHEALRDPAQAADALAALQPLEFNPRRGQAVEETAKLMLDGLLYGGDTTALCQAAVSPDPEIAGRAQDLIIGTYPWSQRDIPEVTAHIVAHHRSFLQRFVLTERDSNIAYNGRSNTMATLMRALAEAPREDMVALMQSLQAGAGETRYDKRQSITSIYKAALDYLVGGNFQESLLRKLDLDVGRVMEAWAAGHGGRIVEYQARKSVRSGAKFMRDNIRTLLELEVEAPGICRALGDDLGICSFARYTPEMLRETYRALDNPPESYILVATAKNDPNGAFSRNSHSEAIRQQIQADNPDALLIPVELDSLGDIWRIVRNLRRRGWGPAEHVMLHAHGKTKSSRLGVDSIAVDNDSGMKGSWYALGLLMRHAIKDGGTFTLGSCSTGRGPDCLAAHIAQTSGKTTFAPDEDVAVKDITMRRDPTTGKLVPEIHYINADTGAPLPTRVFRPTGATQ